MLGRDHGPVLVTLSVSRFRVTGQPIEVEFAPGSMVSKFLDWPRGTATTQRRVSPAQLSRADLAGDFLLTFTRRGGRIDGMVMGSGRVRGVRFTRAGR